MKLHSKKKEPKFTMYNLHSASLQVPATVRPEVPNTPNYQLNMLVYESQS